MRHGHQASGHDESGKAVFASDAGTRHAWRNPFDETCLLVVVVVIGANHRDVG